MSGGRCHHLLLAPLAGRLLGLVVFLVGTRLERLVDPGERLLSLDAVLLLLGGGAGQTAVAARVGFLLPASSDTQVAHFGIWRAL